MGITPKERSRQWRINNPERSKSQQISWAESDPEKAYKSRRNTHLKRKFKITLDQYEAILISQNNCCAVCHKDRSEFDRAFAVDHNHNTNEIRGLLCFYCNFKLVANQTDGSLYRRVADYIDSGTGIFINVKDSST